MTGYFARFPSTARSVAKARRTIKNFARSCGFSGRLLTDVEVAAGEAVAHAIEIGRATKGFFSLRCGIVKNALVIEIESPVLYLEDRGDTLASEPKHASAGAEEPSPRGFGALIMHKTMDSVTYEDCGRRIRLTKALPAAGSAAVDQKNL